MGRSRLRPALFPNCPPYLNFIPGGEQVCSHCHFSFCINSPKVQHVLPGRTYLNFISGGNMTDHIVIVSMEEMNIQVETYLDSNNVGDDLEHETDLKPG